MQNKNAILEEAAIILEQSAWHKPAKDLRSLKDKPDDRSLKVRIVHGLISAIIFPVSICGALLGMAWYVSAMIDYLNPSRVATPLIAMAALAVPAISLMAFCISFSKGEKK